ncbi:MAG: cupin domain-containing protein [Chitinophagales bacterium]|nr:cupin domain-containing protein [Chitinophagales bacterium]
MNEKISKTNKQVVVKHQNNSKKFWMADKEYTGIVVGKEQTNSEYVISDGVIEAGGFVPDHYHKWEDQTFHVIKGKLEAKIGNEIYQISAGDTIHCPRGITHYIKNVGDEDAFLISYIFPGDWAEDFMEETSRQVQSGKPDFKLIEEKFGVVYV